MKKLFFLFLCFVALAAVPAHAGKILGGDLTYTCIAPNNYVVNFKYVQDCSAVPPASTVNLQLRSPGCNPVGRIVVLNKVGAYNLVYQTCANGLTPNCSPDNQAGNAFAVTYTGVISFSASEQACTNWMLGVTVDAETRAASANLVGTPPLYLEAYLKLGPFINNSSVEYSPLNLPYTIALYNYKSLYPINASEADGDSLVYSFRPALQGPGNATAVYKAPYTFQSPFPSTPAIALNNYGWFEFNPSVFVPNSTPTQGDNRYVTVLQVDEYRKINGVLELIGSTQRDMIFNIQEPILGVNNAPKLENFKVNGQPYSPLTPLVLTAGQLAMVTFEATDLDSLDLVRMSIDSSFFWNNGLASFRIFNNGIMPHVEMRFTPTTNHVQPALHYLPIKLEDNSCPVKAITTEVLTFEVRGALGTRPELAARLDFKAYPNPFTDELHFQFLGEAKAQTILIYNLVGQEIDQIQLENGTSETGKIAWKNAGKYAAGTYVAKLITQDKTVQNLKFTKL